MAAWLDHFWLYGTAFTPRARGADLPTPVNALQAWHRDFHSPAGLPHRVPPSLLPGGSGILTGCPSPTPFGLGLGPTNPTRMNLPSETLGFRRTRFSRVSRYSCRHSHFCPLHRSFRYGFDAGRTLPYQPCSAVDGTTATLQNPAASVPGLSPVTFSAQDHSTSELLRTL